MLHRKRHDLITSALVDANKAHGYTNLQRIMDRANDEVLAHAEHAGAPFGYTRAFILAVDRLFKETYLTPQPQPLAKRQRPRRKIQS